MKSNKSNYSTEQKTIPEFFTQSTVKRAMDTSESPDADTRWSTVTMKNFVGKICLQIYNDAKCLDLDAWSWPSRFICEEAGHAFRFDNLEQSTINDDLDLEYINPSTHLSIMSTIVKSHNRELKETIEKCLALSLRIDSYIDWTNIDNIYVTAKLINHDGTSQNIFLGIGQLTDRQAKGLMNAVSQALNTIVHDPTTIYKKVSSICTDGTAIGVGEGHGFCLMIEEEIQKANSEIPLMKIWCSVHRTDLAWENASNDVTELSKIFSVLHSISSFLNCSAMCAAELKDVAEKNNLELLTVPKIFEGRWSEFTFELIESVLVSWKALVVYFKGNTTEATCAGLEKHLTKVANIKLLAFLSDILLVFKRLQNQIQSDRLTLITFHSYVQQTIADISKLQNEPLPGGNERKFNDLFQMTSDKIYLENIKLIPTKTEHRLRPDFTTVRDTILSSLRTFLQDRFKVDEEILTVIKSFMALDANANIHDIHRLLGSDLNLASLSSQYQEIRSAESLSIYKDLSLNELIAKLTQTETVRANYKELIIVFARIHAATPRSTDVEHWINANDRLKNHYELTSSVQSDINYLYINTNMPVAEEWNPKAAVNLWIDNEEYRNVSVVDNVDARSQPYFIGVFEAASKKKKDSESDEMECCSF